VRRKHGQPVESICGVDRAMMYLLASWTGFRKGEIGSLRKKSFDFRTDTPTVTVTAMFSKRKREDTQALHAELAKRMKEWFAGKGDALGESLLFPVSGKVPGGTERKTEKMMSRDLGRAKDVARARRRPTMSRRRRVRLLKYCDSQGRFADHANRHTFITNLGHAGVSPKAAQELARHSDIRLTLGVYSHTDLPRRPPRSTDFRRSRMQ
jgi:integrase